MPMDTPTTHPSLGDLLLLFRRKIIESMKRDALKHDLTFSQVEILQFIGRDGRKTMKSIATHLQITPPSTTALITEMERKGLVIREPDPDDHRRAWIVFTPKTKKLFTAICTNKELVLHKMVSRLSSGDQKTLGRIIKTLITE